MRAAAGESIAANNQVVEGNKITVSGNNNTVHGNRNTVSGNNNKVHGDHNTATGNNNIVYGNHNTATGKNTQAIGKNNQVTDTSRHDRGTSITITRDGVTVVPNNARCGRTVIHNHDSTVLNQGTSVYNQTIVNSTVSGSNITWS